MAKTNYYELIELIHQGDEYAVRELLNAMEPAIRVMAVQITAQNYDVILEYEELVQIGRIALFRAADEFRPDRNASFPTYAGVVIHRSMVSAIRHFGRRSCIRRSKLVSLDQDINGRGALINNVEDRSGMNDPVYWTEYEEARVMLNAVLDSLSEMEKKVIAVWQNGHTYEEAARKLGITVKSYDGMLQRVRKKLWSIRVRPDDD